MDLTDVTDVYPSALSTADRAAQLRELAGNARPALSRDVLAPARVFLAPAWFDEPRKLTDALYDLVAAVRLADAIAAGTLRPVDLADGLAGYDSETKARVLTGRIVNAAIWRLLGEPDVEPCPACLCTDVPIEQIRAAGPDGACDLAVHPAVRLVTV